MLNRECSGYSGNKRPYADFSIETLLRKDFSKDWGKLRHSNNSLEIDSGGEQFVTVRKDLVSFVNQEHYQEVDNHLIETVVSEETILSVLDKDGTDGGGDDGPDGNSPKHDDFPWLRCTRFKPPKLTRSRRRSNNSKRNGRGPRIPFSSHQLAVLERTFRTSQYLSSKAIGSLVESLQLTEVRVKIWFQNRRARYRRESDSSTQPDIITQDRDRTRTSNLLLSLQDNRPHHQPCFVQSDPILSSSHSVTSPSETYYATSTALSKQSFRHLINDLNLMTANVNSSSRNFNPFLKTCSNAHFGPTSNVSS